MVGTVMAANGWPTVALSGYVNGPPEPVVVQLKLPVKVPAVEPLYETVTVPGTPAARFSGLGETLKPAPVAVQVTAAAPPVAVKLSEAELVLAGRLIRGKVTAVPDTVPLDTVATAAGQVSAQLRVKGEPETVGVAVSVQLSVAVAAAAARVHDRLIDPVVVVVLKMPLAGVVVTAPNEAAPGPEMAHPVTADWPVAAAPAAVMAIVALAAPAAPLGKVTPAAVVGL